jgi:hypothetical protein
MLRSYYSPQLFASDMINTIPLYFIAANQSIEDALNGVSHGVFPLTGEETLNIVPHSGFSSGTHTVSVYVPIESHIVIKNSQQHTRSLIR